MGYKTTLGEVSLNGGSYGIGAPAVDFDPGLPMYLRITDIKDDGTLNTSDRKSVDDPSADSYLLKEGDIVFARTGNSTGRSYYYDARDGAFAFAGFLIKFSLDSKKINPRFMKYYSQSKLYWDWVTSFNAGSTRGNINAKTYASMPLELPSRQDQDCLVAFCDAIADKIRINNQLNDYLTELLDAKFDRMLEGSSSWSEASLLDIASYKNGLAMQKFRPKSGDSGLPVLKIRELGQGCCEADAERCQSDIDEGVMVHDGDLIFSWSGTLLLDFWAGGDAGLNQHLFKVTSESYPSWFYYMWTKHHLHKFIAMAKDRATTMGHIKRSALADSRVLIPEQGTLAELTNSMQPIVNQVITNKVECRKLSELRDALLPKLMSGEIDASKVDITQLNNHLSDC